MKDMWTAVYCSTNRNACCQRNIRFLSLSGTRNILVKPQSVNNA